MLDAHFALQDQKLLGDLSQLAVFVNGSFCRAEDAKFPFGITDCFMEMGFLRGSALIRAGFSN